MNPSASRWISSLFLLPCLALLAFGGTASRGKAAQATTSVIVANASNQPVPVQVPARPSTGAYIVAIANAPKVTVGGTPTVTVTNSSAAPVQTKTVDGGYANEVQYTYTVTINDGHYGNGMTASSVPTGKRLVIENIAAFSRESSGGFANIIIVQSTDNLGKLKGLVAVPCNPAWASTSASIGNVTTNLVVDAGQYVWIEADRTNATGFNDNTVTLTGHMIDYP